MELLLVSIESKGSDNRPSRPLHRAAAVFSFAFLGLIESADASPPIESYGRLPAIELVRLSPSGERIALVGVVGETRRLFIATPDGKQLKGAVIGDGKVRDLHWAGNDQVLVSGTATVDLRMDFGNTYELESVVHVALNNSAPWTIFNRSRDVAPAVFGFYGVAMEDGRWVGYFGGLTQAQIGTVYAFQHGYPDLYQVDLETGRATLKAKGGDNQYQWVVSADGGVSAHSEYDPGKGEWRLYAGSGRTSLLVHRSSPRNEIDVIGAGRSAGTVLLADSSSGADRLEEISLSDGKSAPLPITHSIVGYRFDPVTNRLIGFSTSNDLGESFFDPDMQARIENLRSAFPDRRVHLESYTRNLDCVIVETEGPKDSGTFWFVDIESGKVVPLGHPYPDVKSADVAVTSRFAYAAGDGTKIEGILTLPPGRQPKGLPLMVMPHGGPIGIHDSLGFDWWSQGLASRGYAVFQPNYRGSDGYGVEFRRAGEGQWGRKMLTDIADGVAALSSQQIIDPKRVCIIGGSYGGYAALAGVTLQQGLYRCAVSVAGPSDMQTFVAWEAARYGSKNDNSRYWQMVTGAAAGANDVLRAISPASFAAKADAPILLIHGKDDTRVPIEQSEQMAAALRRAGKPYEFVALPNEDHFLSREITRTAMLKAAVSFVEKYNPPE